VGVAVVVLGRRPTRSRLASTLALRSLALSVVLSNSGSAIWWPIFWRGLSEA